MPNDINNQIIRSYDEGASSAVYDEVHNQQLNEALLAGTVEGILMKSGYVAQYDHNVVIKREIRGFVTLTELISKIDASSFDFKSYDNNTTHIQLKHHIPNGGGHPTAPLVPNLTQLNLDGEIAIDNWDGSIYVVSHKGGTSITKNDAGTVNGHIVQRDVLATGPDATLTETEIKTLINSAFVFDQGNNKLTIKQLS